jgi:hypothetical protein
MTKTRLRALDDDEEESNESKEDAEDMPSNSLRKVDKILDTTPASLELSSPPPAL